MKPGFPFIEVPESKIDIIGKPKSGTRTYSAYLWREQYQGWFFAVDELCHHRGVLAPVAAADFVQVTRAAVYKRIRQGNLTEFQFHEIEQTIVMEDGSHEYVTKGHPVCFIPFIECMAWVEEIAPRVKLKSGEDIVDYYLNKIGGENDAEE